MTIRTLRPVYSLTPGYRKALESNGVRTQIEADTWASRVIDKALTEILRPGTFDDPVTWPREYHDGTVTALGPHGERVRIR